MSRKADERKVDDKLEVRGRRVSNDREGEKFKHLEQKNHEKRQSYQQLVRYNPWGKPGGGAPNDVRKRQKFLQADCPLTEMEFADALQSSLSFGRPGHGAPLKTKSGRLRSQIAGDPVIRFQDSQNVHKSVENGIRYFRGRKAQDEYKNDLDNLVQQKMENKLKEKEIRIQLEETHGKNYPFGHEMKGESSKLRSPTCPRSVQQPPSSLELNYDPWGKGFGTPRRDQFGFVLPRLSLVANNQHVVDWETVGSTIPMGKYSGGDGAPHLAPCRSSPNMSNGVVAKLPCTLSSSSGAKGLDLTVDVAVANETKSESGLSPRFKERQTLMEKLGWTGDESKMTEEAKKNYLHELKVAIEEKNVSQRNKQDEDKFGGVEFAQLMRDKQVGYPFRKENQLFGLSSTDITKTGPLSCPVFRWSNAEYRDELDKQKEKRQAALRKMKEKDVADSEKHFETLDSVWGRPGHGAPRDANNHRKEGVGPLYKVHSKIPLLPTSAFISVPVNYQRKHLKEKKH